VESHKAGFPPGGPREACSTASVPSAQIFPPESRSIFFTYATDYKVLVMQLALGTEKLDLGESAEQILEAPGDGS